MNLRDHLRCRFSFHLSSHDRQRNKVIFIGQVCIRIWRNRLWETPSFDLACDRHIRYVVNRRYGQIKTSETNPQQPTELLSQFVTKPAIQAFAPPQAAAGLSDGRFASHDRGVGSFGDNV